MMYETFATWTDLLTHIRADYKLYYQAPMDYRPAVVNATIRKDGKLRINVPFGDCDNFTADESHLSRFRRLASRRTTA